MYEYPGRVHRIIDGDTGVFWIDLGFGVWVKQTCRLRGINAPEIRGSRLTPQQRAAGYASRDHLELLCNDCGPLTLHTIKDRTGKFGRYLVMIWAKDEKTGDPMLLNTRMVTDGHAVKAS